MYPKNSASPPRISVGAVIQISDGAVQTSGVSIAVVPEGGASGAGGGTTAYDNGIVLYTPTQAETNYSAFVVTAYKTGCVPASVTIVTTASATAGNVIVGDKTGFALAADQAVNASKIGGTTQTGRDLGASVLLAADQAVNVTKIAGTTQTAGVDLGVAIPDLDTEVDAIAAVIGNIAVTGAALSKEAGTFTNTGGGTVTGGSITDTAVDNGVLHAIQATAGGLIDVDYTFELPTTAVGSRLAFAARLIEAAPAGGDSVSVYLWDYVGAAWELVHTNAIVGSLISSPVMATHSQTLLSRHTGTGADAGKVRARFYTNTAEGTTTTLGVDQVIVEYAESLGAVLAGLGLTVARTGYLDNLNTGGVVAVPNDIAATQGFAEDAKDFSLAAKGYLEALTTGGLGAEFTAAALAKAGDAIALTDWGRVVSKRRDLYPCGGWTGMGAPVLTVTPPVDCSCSLCWKGWDGVTLTWRPILDKPAAGTPIPGTDPVEYYDGATWRVDPDVIDDPLATSAFPIPDYAYLQWSVIPDATDIPFFALRIEPVGRLGVSPENETGLDASDCLHNAILSPYIPAGARYDSFVNGAGWAVVPYGQRTGGDWSLTRPIFDRLGAPAGASIAADIAATASTLGTPAGASIAADIAAIAGGSGAPVGPGDSPMTIEVRDSLGNPVADAEVWITSDADGDTLVAGTLRTGDDGKVTTPFMLTVGGNYFAWRRKAGVNFDDNPVAFVGVADA